MGLDILGLEILGWEIEVGAQPFGKLRVGNFRVGQILGWKNCGLENFDFGKVRVRWQILGSGCGPHHVAKFGEIRVGKLGLVNRDWQIWLWKISG